MDSTQPPLSAREIEIVELVADGCSTAEIANLLYISPNTIKTHLKNVFRKCAVCNRAELVAWWCRRSAPAELMKPGVDQHIGLPADQPHRRRPAVTAMALGGIILVTAVIGFWPASDHRTVVEPDVSGTQRSAWTHSTDDGLLSASESAAVCQQTETEAGSDDVCAARIVP